MSVTIQIENVESSNDIPVDNHIPLDDILITTGAKNGPVLVSEGMSVEIDCFGRIRTTEEIKERSNFRKNVCMWIFSITLLLTLVIFPITMLVSLPVRDGLTPDNGNVNALFIVSSIIVCITWGPIVIGFIGFILILIGDCCYQLL